MTIENTKAQTKALNEALIKAAHNDDWASAKRVIAEGADIYYQDERGDAASIIFALNGNCRAVLGLARMSKGTLELADNGGSTPGICMAMQNHGEAALRVAREHPHIIRHVNGRGNTMATWFAQYQNVQAVYALACLNGGVFAQEDKDGPITWTRFKGHADAETVRKLQDLERRRRSNW